MTSKGRSSHVASGLSVADILAVLYGAVVHHDPTQPDLPDRDRVILSKGHAGAAMYAVLAEQGYFARELLDRHYADGSPLSGHVSHFGVPGVEVSTGSLGHGLSIGVGMTMAAKRRPNPFRVFVVLSDGECDEGSVWEAAMFAAHHRLGPLTAIVDYNKIQSLDTTTATLDLEPLDLKWRAFGWDVSEVDGHDHEQLTKVLSDAARIDDPPRCVIAHTTKGKGVPFMENSVLWHYRSPSDEELAAALAALPLDGQ
jgi:transketolase